MLVHGRQLGGVIQMRLSTFGLVMVTVSYGWLYGNGLAAQERLSDIKESTPDAAYVLARVADTSIPRLESEFTDYIAGPMEQSLQGTRFHQALATPLLPKRTVGTPLGATAIVSDSGRQPPSSWMMAAVIVLLIAYQLRRKHRFLRPLRFNEL